MFDWGAATGLLDEMEALHLQLSIKVNHFFCWAPLSCGEVIAQCTPQNQIVVSHSLMEILDFIKITWHNESSYDPTICLAAL